MSTAMCRVGSGLDCAPSTSEEENTVMQRVDVDNRFKTKLSIVLTLPSQ